MTNENFYRNLARFYVGISGLSGLGLLVDGFSQIGSKSNRSSIEIAAGGALTLISVAGAYLTSKRKEDSFDPEEFASIDKVADSGYKEI